MSRRHRKPKADRIDGFSPPDPSSQDYWRTEAAKKQMKAFAQASGHMDEINLDGFVNQLTGIGDWTQDKTFGGQSSGLEFVVTLLSGIDCENRWRGSDLGGRIVETLPDEMTREGWHLQIQPSDDDEEDKQDAYPPAAGGDSPPSAGAPPPLPPQALKLELREINDEGTYVAQEILDLCEDLEFDDRLVEALQYERAYGGAGILVGADDGLDLTQPLDLERVRSVNWLNTFRGGWDGEIVAWSYYTDPAAPNYGMPEMYMLRNLGVPVVKVPAPGETLSTAQLARPGYASSYGTLISWVHESRFLLFPGTAVSRRARVQMRGWGDSVFTRIDRVLSHYDQTWAGIANLMTEFSQGVLKIDGLAQTLAANNKNGTSTLSNRARAIQMSKSIARMLLIDKQEEYKRETAVLGGVPEMLQQFSLRLAAAADMPVDLLMGQSAAGGLNKGDTTIRFFYDRIKSRQKRRLTPKIKQFISVLFAASNGPTEGNDIGRVSVVHNSLYQMTEGEKADLRLKTNQADDLEIKNQVLLPEEVAASEWAGAEWSANRTIDFEGRAAMAEQDQKDKEARARQMLEQAKKPSNGTPENNGSPVSSKPESEPPDGTPASGGGHTVEVKVTPAGKFTSPDKQD